jgi:hypothetical protein
MAIPMFLGSRNSAELSGRLFRLAVETGSEKFKMAAAKLDVPVSQLLYNIAQKFQQLSICFR